MVANTQPTGALPSPMGRGWREAPGEGIRSIGRMGNRFMDGAYPLTLSLSPWERGPEAAFTQKSAVLHRGEV
jgi:hypothetical protein